MSIFRFFKGSSQKSPSPQQGFYDPRFQGHEPHFMQDSEEYPRGNYNGAPGENYTGSPVYPGNHPYNQGGQGGQQAHSQVIPQSIPRSGYGPTMQGGGDFAPSEQNHTPQNHVPQSHLQGHGQGQDHGRSPSAPFQRSPMGSSSGAAPAYGQRPTQAQHPQTMQAQNSTPHTPPYFGQHINLPHEGREQNAHPQSQGMWPQQEAPRLRMVQPPERTFDQSPSQFTQDHGATGHFQSQPQMSAPSYVPSHDLQNPQGQQGQGGQQRQGGTDTFFTPPPANTHVQNSSDLRDLRFWAHASEEGEEVEENGPEDHENNPLKFVFALGILIIFSALAWVIFKWSTQTVTNVSPHIQADQTPYKVRPDHPGGMNIPHQDKLIYGKLGHETNLPEHQQGPQGEHILPPPEAVMQPGAQPYATAPQGYYQGQGQGQGQEPMQMQQVQGQPQMYPQQIQGGYPQQEYPQNQGQPQAYGPIYPQHQGAYGKNHPHIQQQPQGAYPQQQKMPEYRDEDGEMMEENTPNNHPSNPSGNPQNQFYPNNVNAVPASSKKAQSVTENTDINGIIENAHVQKNTPKNTLKNPSKTTPQTFPQAPTGFLPGGIPTNPQNMGTQGGNTQEHHSLSHSFYKARLASLPTKKAAEQEWDRLKKMHPEQFKNLNKAILEQVVSGKKYHVLYVLGIQTEEKAKAFCKKMGKNCTYVKQ